MPSLAVAGPAPHADRADEPAGRQVLAALAFAAATFAAAGLGSLITAGATDTDWFRALDLPAGYPPTATFGIVWTVLYVMIALAGFLAWRAGAPPRAMALWAGQMALNLGWTAVFFGLRRPGWAVAEIVVLLAAVLATMVAFRRVDRLAAALLCPYAAWTAYAAYLTIAIAAG